MFVGIVLIMLIDMRMSSLKMDSICPWFEAPDYIEQYKVSCIQGCMNSFFLPSWLWIWVAASSFCHLDFLALMEFNLALWAKIKPFSAKLHLSEDFITTETKINTNEYLSMMHVTCVFFRFEIFQCISWLFLPFLMKIWYIYIYRKIIWHVGIEVRFPDRQTVWKKDPD